VTMITIVVASFGALSPRCVIVPRQSKQVTGSSRQHQKLRFPSVVACFPSSMSGTSNIRSEILVVIKIQLRSLCWDIPFNTVTGQAGGVSLLPHHARTGFGADFGADQLHVECVGGIHFQTVKV
jgi:hypothetical protein